MYRLPAYSLHLKNPLPAINREAPAACQDSVLPSAILPRMYILPADRPATAIRQHSKFAVEMCSELVAVALFARCLLNERVRSFGGVMDLQPVRTVKVGHCELGKDGQGHVRGEKSIAAYLQQGFRET